MSKESYRKYVNEKRAAVVLNFSNDQRDQINDYCLRFGGTATHIKNLLRQDMLAHGVTPLDTPTAEKRKIDV